MDKYTELTRVKQEYFDNENNNSEHTTIIKLKESSTSKNKKNKKSSIENLEEKYRIIFEKSPVAITVLNEKEQIISWNNYTEKLLGMGKNDLYLKPVKSLYPVDEWNKIRSENIREKGMQHHLETKIYKKNGKLLDVDISLSVIKDENNKIVGSIGIIKDISEKKEIEKKIQNDRALLQSLIDNIPDSIYFKDKDNKFILVNKAKASHSKVQPEDMIGKTDFDFLAEEQAIKAYNDDTQIVKKGKIITNEIEKITHNDGTNRWVSVTKLPRIDITGKTIGSMGISRDITNLKKAEGKIIESEKKFRTIFDDSSDFLMFLDQYGKVVDINITALNLLGIEKKEAVNKPMEQLKNIFNQIDLKKHLEIIEEVTKKQCNLEYESTITTLNNKTINYSFSSDCIKENDKIMGILLRGRDITQQKIAWDELSKLEEKYRILAETLADGVVTIDQLGTISYVNPSFENIIGIKKTDLIDTLFREYLSDESVYLFAQTSVDIRSQDKKIENVELELKNKKGDIVPIEVNFSPMKKEKKFSGIVCTIRDISEHKKIENELKKSEKLKTEFMNIAAHELKSPVTPIKGYLDLIISDKNTSEQVKKWAGISKRNAERLLILVNDILDVARLDSDTMRFDIEKIDINEILDEIVEDMKPAVENKNLDFLTEIQNDLNPVLGDKYRLSQVMKNLLVNAIKFTDKGHIGIKAHENGQETIISVEDTGVGIPISDTKKIFSKFYQSYTGDDRKHEGTGLGLFICQQILEKHNGKIWVESTIQKGSTFYISIPHL